MELVLGPCPADEVLAWTKIARRIMVELTGADRAHPDQLSGWSRLVESWSSRAAETLNAGNEFRWAEPMEPEMAEFLLYGLDKHLHSPVGREWVTAAEAETHSAMTLTIVRAFADALWAEGDGCQHFADQVLSGFSTER